MSRRLNLPPSTTLAEAEAVMRPLVWEAEGVICPLCRQHAQVYKWSLYSTAAHALILLLKLGGRDKPIHTKEIKKLGHTGQGDISRLRIWGLAEEERVRRPDDGRAGFWWITGKGEDFAHNRTTLPKHAWVYDTRVMRYEGDPVTIKDALGTKFDYRKLMDGTWGDETDQTDHDDDAGGGDEDDEE